MNTPPRVIIAVIVAGVLVSVALAALLALFHPRLLGFTAPWPRLLLVAVAVVLAALAAWVLFIAPAYWD